MESIKLLRNECLVIILLVLTACSSGHSVDNRLTNFELIDKKLDSVTVDLTKGINKKISRDSLFVGLSLNLKKDTIIFEYSIYKDIYSAKMYNVLLLNRRVIGYTQKGDMVILLFSDINNHFDMTNTLSKLIKPTKKYREIDLHNEYINNENWKAAYMIDQLKVCFYSYQGKIIKVYSGF